MYSYATYTGNGVLTQFTIPCPYLAQAHIHVYVAGVETTDFTINTGTNKVVLEEAPANAVAVKVQRITPRTEAGRVVDFASGAGIPVEDLDNSALQSLYIQQESFDEQALVEERVAEVEEKTDAVDAAVTASQAAAATATTKAAEALASANQAQGFAESIDPESFEPALNKRIPTPTVLAAPARGAVLPGFFKYLKSYRADLAPVIKTVGLGSSVSNGAALLNPTVDAPLPFFTTTLNTYLNRVPIYTLEAHNYGVDGSTVINGVSTAYPAAVAAGHPGKIVLLAYGMNDGQTAQYNAGQTYEGAYTQLAALIDAIVAQGAEAVICTTPHPHTVRNGFAMPGGIAQSYPTAVASPVDDEDLIPPADESVLNIDWQGQSIEVSYRHYRVNEAFRAVAREKGCALIDVERYWFDAVAEYGQDALYDPLELVHPNLFGHQKSYHLAIADFIKTVFDSRNVEIPQVASVAGRFGDVTLAQADINGLKTTSTPAFAGVSINAYASNSFVTGNTFSYVSNFYDGGLGRDVISYGLNYNRRTATVTAPGQTTADLRMEVGSAGVTKVVIGVGLAGAVPTDTVTITPGYHEVAGFSNATGFESLNSAGGIILKAPDGGRWRVLVDNAGALSVVAA